MVEFVILLSLSLSCWDYSRRVHHAQFCSGEHERGGKDLKGTGRGVHMYSTCDKQAEIRERRELTRSG